MKLFSSQHTLESGLLIKYIDWHGIYADWEKRLVTSLLYIVLITGGSQYRNVKTLIAVPHTFTIQKRNVWNI